MFTIESTFEDVVVTTLDNTGEYEDVEMIVTEDGTIIIRQFEEDNSQYEVIEMSMEQLTDLMVALNKPEGCYR